MKPNLRKILEWLCIACIVYGIVTLSGPLTVNILYLLVSTNMDFSASETVSIGIIGGADGPTSILLAVSPWINYVFPFAVLILGVTGLYCLRRK